MEEVGVRATLEGPSAASAAASAGNAAAEAAAAAPTALLKPLFLFRFVDPAVCRVWGTAFRATLQSRDSALEFPVRAGPPACFLSRYPC